MNNSLDNRAMFYYLANWSLNEIYDGQFNAKNKREILNLAKKVNYEANEFMCGFEVHHNGDNQVDFLFACNPGHIKFKGLHELPGWWYNLSDKYKNNNQIIHSNGPTKVHYLPIQWFEFEQINNKLNLGGIWQTIVHYTTDRSMAMDFCFFKNNIISFLKEIHGESIEVRSLKTIDSFLKHYSMPSQIGLMSGRGNQLKLVSWIKLEENSYRDFFRRAPFIHMIGGIKRVDIFINILNHLSNSFRVAINLDINCHKDEYIPKVGIEIYPKLQQPSEVIDQIKSICKPIYCIEDETIRLAKSTVSKLPTQKIVATFGASSKGITLKNTDEKLIFNAELDHFKLTFGPSNHNSLKSYISLYCSQKGHQNINLNGATL